MVFQVSSRETKPLRKSQISGGLWAKLLKMVNEQSPEWPGSMRSLRNSFTAEFGGQFGLGLRGTCLYVCLHWP